MDADDAILRARVALTLGHELRDHAHKFAASGRGSSGGTLRAAVQTLRVALNAANRARAEAADPDLHEPVEAADHAALARQSITADVDDVSAAAAAAGRLGAHGYGGSGVFGAGSQLDTLDQALAAVHLDLIDARACVNHQPPASPQVPLSIASRMPTSHGTQKVLGAHWEGYFVNCSGACAGRARPG